MFNEYKENINMWLEDYFKGKGTYEKTIYESMEYSIKVGGKRIRPILMLLACELYEKDLNKVMPFACSMEMIHTYSLIHDDLPCMDDDDLRRGKPTNHKVYGEAIAVLAGDGLLNEASRIVINECQDGDLSRLKAGKEILDAASVLGMIGGQVVDVESEGKEIDLDTLKYIHKNKTGKLITASLVSGALLGNANKEQVAIIREYGEKLGLAFQIKDDILDIIGDQAKLGKNIKSDIENEKVTYVSFYGLEKSKDICEEITNECYELLSKLDGNTDKLKKITEFLLNRDY